MKVKGFRDLPDPVVTDDVKKMFRRSKRKKTDYFFITAFQKNLNGERMLVLDVFMRVDGEIKPMLRCFFGKEEYVTLDLQEKPKWRDGALDSIIGYRWYSWQRKYEVQWASDQDRITAQKWFKAFAKRNGYAFELDQEAKAHTDIDEYQIIIREKKNRKKWQAERDRMDMVMKTFGKLPKDWKEFSQKTVMDEHNYFFYQMGKDKGLAYCSRCQHEFKIRKEKGEWMTWGVDVPVWIKGKPKHNRDFYCPACNKLIPSKSIGYGHNLVEIEWSCLVQHNGENQVQVRFHRHIKDYRQDFRHPTYHCDELFRFVHFPDAVIDATFDIDKHFNREDWIPIPNKPWFSNPSVFSEPAHRTVLYNQHLEDDLKDTWLRYCSVEKFLQLNPEQKDPWFINVFIGTYRKYPYMEKLVKIGFGNLAEVLMGWGTVPMQDGRNICEVLKLSRENFLLLKAVSSNPRKEDLEVLQKVQELGQRVTEDELSALINMQYLYRIHVEDVLELRQYTTIHKLWKYIGTQHSRVSVDMKDYVEYIRWIREMGADLKNEFNLFPKDFWEAHDRKSNEYVAFKDARFRELMKEFNKQLEKQKATKAESMAVAGLLIRLPRKIEELDREGEALHHCVGTYKQRVIAGETRIFFIRQEADPEKPYYTLEWKDDHVVQCRGRNNCNMTPEVKAFVKIFEEKMGAKKKRRRAS